MAATKIGLDWVDQAKAMRAAGVTAREVAKASGVSASSVMKYCCLREHDEGQWVKQAHAMRRQGFTYEIIAKTLKRGVGTVYVMCKDVEVVEQRAKPERKKRLEPAHFEEIRRLKQQGASLGELKEKFKVSDTTIRKVTKGMGTFRKQTPAGMVEKARELRASGMFMSDIARQLGVSRDSVKRYLGEAAPPAQKPLPRHLQAQEMTPEQRRRMISKLLFQETNRTRPPVTLPKLKCLERDFDCA